jgi:hypothetical protein
VTTASEIITDALIDINALAPGQPLNPNNGAVALRKLNDLMDSLSVDKDFVYVQTENVFTGWTPGQYKYSVGNPVGGTFNGTLVGGSPTISGVTVPSGLVVGGTITDIQASVPAGTTILSFNAGAGTVTMSQNAIVTVNPAEQFTFTTPGNINIPRPLRITSGYTRITSSGNTGLDYWFDCTLTMERYNELGYKGVPGPWPIVLAYQPTFPLGTIWIYPNPTQAGEVHLFTDIILNNGTSVAFPLITTNYNLPQGYARALKKLAAIEFCPSYGKTPSAMLLKAAAEARAFIKSLNASPATTLRYDSDIVRSQQHDAGWIMHGGFV